MSVVFSILLLLPVLGIPLWNTSLNPYSRHRAEGTSSTGHTIVIDEHYQVHTLSGSQSVLSYRKDPQTYEAKEKILSQAVDRLNWNEDYIIASAKGSNGEDTFMIVQRDTVERTGYANKKDFEKGKEEKGIEISLKNKRAFDWY